jgi:hypothetical protein
MLNIWTQPSGYTWTTNQFGFDSGATYFDQKRTIFDPGPIVERINITLPLPIVPTSGVTFKVISGSLPLGLAIVGNVIKGIPYGVVRDTTYTFCIRASKGTDIADRTFSITVGTGQPPHFLTPGGLLPVGTNKQRYILNNNFVDFKIQAEDYDKQPITYFIASGDGILPPGLTIDPNGRIHGFVNPELTVPVSVTGGGAYDIDFYDASFYDFASRPTNGYDSYNFDHETFDFSTPTLPPKSINQRYEFIVTAVAGTKTIKRTFGIFVVSPELLTADDAVITDDTVDFTADVTPLEAPLFVNDANLGTFRANNYITIEISTFKSATTTTPYFTIDNENKLPPGLKFAPVGDTVFLAGYVPFQAAISKTYSFVITGTRIGEDIVPANTSKTFSITLIGEVNNTVSWITDSLLGDLPANFNSNFKIEAVASDSRAVVIYSKDIQPGEIGLPPGLDLDVNGEIVGKINQFGVANIPRFTTFENGAWYLDRHFTTIDNSHQYDIVGKRGLILFDQDTGFDVDSGRTTFDRTYKFTIKATDQYGYSIAKKQFQINVSTPNQILYSNIRTRPFLKSTQRNAWTTFINNPTIFDINSIYRPADSNFGVQTDLNMLVYAGIQTTHAEEYVGAMGLNHKLKRFHFGSIKKGVAIENGKTVYEVVYIEMIDPLEPATGVLPSKIKYSQHDALKVTSDISNAVWQSPVDENGNSNSALLNLPEPYLGYPLENVTIDSNAYNVSDLSPNTYYPNNISNWQKNIESTGQVERNYLPVWMRSIQPGMKEQLGFKLAVPLCYCKPGTANSIILNIKHSGFDFRTLDYTVDRYIIDSVDGYSSDKYLVFRNDRITV